MSPCLLYSTSTKQLILKVEREAEGDVAAVTFQQMLVTEANDQENLVEQ
jgi:hypothetical protein